MSRQAEIEHPVNSDDNDPAILRVSAASPGPPCSFTQAEDLVKTSTRQSNQALVQFVHPCHTFSSDKLVCILKHRDPG